MPEITKKISRLVKSIEKLIEDGQKVIAAGRELKDSLPKKPEKPDDTSQ